MQASFFISSNIDGSTISYTIVYTNSSSGDVCNSNVIRASECTNGICDSAFNFDDSSAQPSCLSTEVSVKVFATNSLGDGVDSDVVAIG